MQNSAYQTSQDYFLTRVKILSQADQERHHNLIALSNKATEIFQSPIVLLHIRGHCDIQNGSSSNSFPFFVLVFLFLKFLYP